MDKKFDGELGEQFNVLRKKLMDAKIEDGDDYIPVMFILGMECMFRDGPMHSTDTIIGIFKRDTLTKDELNITYAALFHHKWEIEIAQDFEKKSHPPILRLIVKSNKPIPIPDEVMEEMEEDVTDRLDTEDFKKMRKKIRHEFGKIKDIKYSAPSSEDLLKQLDNFDKRSGKFEDLMMYLMCDTTMFVPPVVISDDGLDMIVGLKEGATMNLDRVKEYVSHPYELQQGHPKIDKEEAEWVLVFRVGIKIQ